MTISTFDNLLSLDRYAKIMGIDPVRFSGATQVHLASGAILFPIYNDVNNIWPQQSYQAHDQVGREDLAQAIMEAEQEIAEFIGYFPGPKWIAQEMHTYPRFYREDMWGNGLDTPGRNKAIKLNYGKFIEGGRRRVTIIDPRDVTLAYSDADADGFTETATITVNPVPAAMTDVCRIKVFYQNHDGDPEYEIREPRYVDLTGGIYTAKFWVWQLIDHEVWDALPTNDNATGGVGIDLTDTANLVTAGSTVDVYYEDTSTTLSSALFYWEILPSGGYCSNCGTSGGCTTCQMDTIDGCAIVRDADAGMVSVAPVIWDTVNLGWAETSWAQSREPENVKVWYRAGQINPRYLRGLSCEQLGEDMAKTIAYLATARLERPFAGNNNTQALCLQMQRDMSRSPSGGDTFMISDDVMNNPFGTKGGEVYAYKKIKKLVQQIARAAIV
jgi:hypothetical protein